MVERGHWPLVEAILKISRDNPNLWHLNLPSALWADRITTKRTTGYSPYELVYRAQPCLPIDIEFETWIYADWKKDMTTADLLVQRIRQLERKEEDMSLAQERMRKTRQTSREYMDKKKGHRTVKPLLLGDLVLIHKTLLEKQWSHKVKDKWMGPYEIIGQLEGGSYWLREMDGTELAKPIAAHRLRRFHIREGR